ALSDVAADVFRGRLVVCARNPRAPGRGCTPSFFLDRHDCALPIHAYSHRLLRRAHVLHTPIAASGAASLGAAADHGRLSRAGHEGGLAYVVAPAFARFPPYQARPYSYRGSDQ